MDKLDGHFNMQYAACESSRLFVVPHKFSNDVCLMLWKRFDMMADFEKQKR
jgi:hypothetical protein